MYDEDDFLALSGIQHFAFCRRQWALIHVEGQWADNALTAMGNVLHDRAHDGSLREKRGDTFVVRGLAVHSRNLGLKGVCDVVEFHADSEGHPLAGVDGLWLPVPVEYKRGRRKSKDVDRIQLCAQAICLEEMFACDIRAGYLFYGATRSRERVEFGQSIRERTYELASDMHASFTRGFTPSAKKTESCKACSLIDICVPELASARTVASYLEEVLGSEGP